MPSNKGPAVITTFAVEFFLATIPVFARLYTRTFIKRALGWDDGLLILGLLLFYGYGITMFICVSMGYGRRYTNFTPAHYSQIVKVELIAQTFCVVSYIPSKCAVGVTLLRVFPGRALAAVLWFLMITVSVVHVIVAVIDFEQCDPPSRLWDPKIPGSCWNPHIFANYGIFSGVWGALFDFCLAAVPWWYIAKLQMKLTEKVAIASAMSLGVFAGACAVAKSVAIKSLSSRTDYAYDTIPLILWAASEQCAILVAASIPTLRPLLWKLQGIEDPSFERQQQYEIDTYGSFKGSTNRNTLVRPPSPTDSEEAVLTIAALARDPRASAAHFAEHSYQERHAF